MNFHRLLSNPHTRIPGIIYLVSKIGLQISEVWFQHYDQQLRATAAIIEGFAVSYGLVAAGNSGPYEKQAPNPKASE